jgi:hypothetical protein
MDIDQPDAAIWNHIKSWLSSEAQPDPLKKHIAVQKKELLVETPHLSAWENIKHSITAKKAAPRRSIKRTITYLSAACIALLAGFSIIRMMNSGHKETDLKRENISSNKFSKHDTISKQSDKSNSKLVYPKADYPEAPERTKNLAASSPKQKKPVKQNPLPPEVLQMQKDYNDLIAGQIKYTKTLAVYGEGVGFFTAFMDDFKLLDEQEKELRRSVTQNGLQENSIYDLAMIYQQKLTVLKKLQNEINKTSMRNRNIKDTVPVYINL